MNSSPHSEHATSDPGIELASAARGLGNALADAVDATMRLDFEVGRVLRAAKRNPGAVAGLDRRERDALGGLLGVLRRLDATAKALRRPEREIAALLKSNGGQPGRGL